LTASPCAPFAPLAVRPECAPNAPRMRPVGDRPGCRGRGWTDLSPSRPPAGAVDLMFVIMAVFETWLQAPWRGRRSGIDTGPEASLQPAQAARCGASRARDGEKAIPALRPVLGRPGASGDVAQGRPGVDLATSGGYPQAPALAEGRHPPMGERQRRIQAPEKNPELAPDLRPNGRERLIQTKRSEEDPRCNACVTAVGGEGHEPTPGR